jgi:hypothetical protein
VTSLGREVSVRNLQVLISSIVLFVDGIFSGFPTINIRHFWLSEKVAMKEVVLEHLGTEDMFANILTKPVQGAQFERERLGLTNWAA